MDPQAATGRGPGERSSQEAPSAEAGFATADLSGRETETELAVDRLAQHISRVHSCSSLRQHPSPTRLSTPTTRFPALCGSFIPWWHLVAEWCCSEHLFLSEVCTV
ncbi:coordinator of PRMT5 and differentiation stimulator isoform X1 [Mus musculus]|uniref:coordinator of PRMT5 and differentiation stimulator isoform X1 n=1 Tax=Mus musculus TaxID=10090 RepID=UPI0005ABA00B|nr:coordinator of PRMT5 and differentiation stimulator isoform X1 [Mus musculus]|eukprot:XP_011240372.1 PREDICTED: coordinator of PRMT5 and differentiation stimulator isoform X1 [Mus musculus]